MPTSRVTDIFGNADFFGNTVRSTARSAPTPLAAPNDSHITIEFDSESEGGLTIDCDCCSLQNTNACDDCVVSFLLEREPEDAVVIDADEARAMRMLERAGLVPTLRFSTQAG